MWPSGLTLIFKFKVQIWNLLFLSQKLFNKPVSQMRVPLVTRREPGGVQNRPQSVLYIFEHKM